MKPLVSVVCLCYNHEQFVREAIESVVNQTYPNIQLIIVDDCSHDGSASIIQQLVDQNPRITFIQLKENIGNCAAFNKGFALVKGDFVIDFATDDVMLGDRIEKQVNQFLKLDQSYGVAFTNADYIDSKGAFLRNHVEHLRGKKLISKIPEGSIFRDVLTRYFICGPTMMVRKKVFD
ncbi:MAG: glycosyltransferase family 2 protein, partial [Bacteroidetes bacterium]|nr:glycosyltransferase family 2 protein [Bacteroidota bacterium]